MVERNPRSNTHRSAPAGRRPWVLGIALAVALAASGTQAQDGAELRVSTLTAGGRAADAGAQRLVSSVSLGMPVGTSAQGSATLLSGPLYLLSGRVGALQVAHTPPTLATSGEPVRVEVEVSGDPAAARLVYATGGTPTPQAVPLAADGDRYGATIPGAAVGSGGLVYFFEFEAGGTLRLPAAGFYEVPVAIPAPGLVTARPLAAAAAYRLFSVPLALTDASADAVLGDDLGAYDPSRWRFFGLSASGALQEVPASGPITPGRGFWLVTDGSADAVDTGAGRTVPLAPAFEVALGAGWSLVGTPYDFSVPLGRVALASGRPVQLRAYEGAWNDPLASPVEAMRPFEGYAIFSESPDRLLIRGLPGPPGGASGAGAPARPGAVHAGEPSLVWGVRIRATSGSARDVDNVAAVVPGAAAGFDPFDWPEPPLPERTLSVRFVAEGDGRALSVDARPEAAAGHVWRLDVEGADSAPVDLAAGLVGEVPEGVEVWLLHPGEGHAQDVRRAPTRRLAAPARDGPERLLLVAGSPTFVAAQRSTWAGASVPEGLLPVYPHPARAGATVRYALERPALADLAVYDVLGRRVAVLREEALHEAGVHAVRWDGRGAGGAPVSSGTYLLVFRVGEVRHTRPLVVVR